MNMIEGENYELIPDDTETKAWNVRILKGPYVETVIRFGAIKFEKKHMKFSFIIVSSPEDDLTVDNVELQEFVAQILEVVIENSIEDGSIQLKEENAGSES